MIHAYIYIYIYDPVASSQGSPPPHPIGEGYHNKPQVELHSPSVIPACCRFHYKKAGHARHSTYASSVNILGVRTSLLDSKAVFWYSCDAGDVEGIGRKLTKPSSGICLVPFLQDALDNPTTYRPHHSTTPQGG